MSFFDSCGIDFHGKGGNIILGFDRGTSSQYIGLYNSAQGFGSNLGFSGIEFGPPAGTDEGYLAFHTHDIDVSSGEKMRIDKSGNVGIGTTNPEATLDVNGYMKLATNISAPVTCDASQDGSLALTSGYQMCACNGTEWVFTSDGTSSCSW